MSKQPPRLHRSRTSDAREHIRLLLRVARMYYQDGATQSQIAASIGYSRPTVSRLLAEARNKDVVRIRIDHPLERAMNMEEELIERFGLHDARIAEVADPMSLPAEVSRCAADYIVETCYEDVAIAVSNGYAVKETIEAMPQTDWIQSRVIQMLGSVSNSEFLIDSSETCRRLARQLGGRHYPLPAPLVVASAEVATSLSESPQVSSILDLAQRSDLALVGIGTVSKGRSRHIFEGLTDSYVSATLIREKAVGHICGHHFDIEGRHIQTSLCDRTIGISLQQIKRLPRVIGVAWGEQKLKAIRGAICGGFISTLVTDRNTALSLLNQK